LKVKPLVLGKEIPKQLYVEDEKIFHGVLSAKYQLF